MINKELLRDYCSEIGVELDENALEQFDFYANALVETNKVMNLTAITEPDEIVVKHFADSLEILSFCNIQNGAKLIDVGTGAGFPGIPLLIARRDIQLTLLDSLRKRLDFLETVIDGCSLDAELVHARAEDAGQNAVLRETFDIATARAVAPLNVLLEYCLPFVKVGGYFIALKGSEEEILSAGRALEELGGEITENVSYKLPNGDPRTIVVVKKISQTPTKYPRKPKKIATAPLE